MEAADDSSPVAVVTTKSKMKRRHAEEKTKKRRDDGVKIKRKEEEVEQLPEVETELTEAELTEASTEKLLQLYGATLAPSDRKIFKMLQNRAVEPMLLFGPKASETQKASTSSNPLYAHSVKANTILASTINNVKAYHTALQYDPTKPGTTSASYDITFLLPLLCHILDEKNICDGVRVVSYGWIYFIIRGMSLEDETLRAEAFLAFQRLIDNFQRAKAKAKGARNKDAQLYLHVLNGFKRGVVELGECRISHLLASWMVGIWEVVRLPSHSMFKRVTSALFSKPTIEMTILPHFIPFYNGGDESRESRTWILNILYHGLKTREDWKIAQKSPTINFLSCSFLLEKVKTQRTIIAILTHGARIPEVAEEMTDYHSLPLWISNLSVTSSRLKSEIQTFFHTLATNCPRNDCRNKIFQFVTTKKGWLEKPKQEEEIKDEEEEEMEVDE